MKSLFCAAMAAIALFAISMTNAQADDTSSDKPKFEGGSAADLLGQTEAPKTNRERMSAKKKIAVSMSCRLPSGQVIDRGHPRFYSCLNRTANQAKDSPSPIPINM